MKFYRETTAWDTDYTVPNHIYLLNTSRDKMYGYLPAGTSEPVVIKKPYQFSSRGRTFEEVPELGEIDLNEIKSTQQWTVAGSNGGQYIVQRVDGVLACTCPGYTFRGQCRHTKEIDSAGTDM